MRGSIAFHGNSTLYINAGLANFHSVNMSSDNITAQLKFNGSSPVINFKDGLTTAFLGDNGRFDLDANGDATVNIEDDASLWIHAEYLDNAPGSPFSGTLNIDGALRVEDAGGQTSWASNGQIILDSGEIAGRDIVNDGLIRGTGSIEGYVINNGEIVADGGTLQFGFVNMDGDNDQQDGVLRAQTGDLVMNMESDGGLHSFTGSIFVGDGQGVREVFNADVELILRDQNGIRGSMSLNSGFVSLEDFTTNGDMTVDGTSLLRTFGTNGADRIAFSNGSQTTVNGTLEVDGRTWFVPGATFSGGGTIDLVNSSRYVAFQDGADLNDVALASSGPILLADSFQCFAGVRALEMRPGAELSVSMFYSQLDEQIVADLLSVQETATLDGTLKISNFPQTQLPVGQTLTVLEADSIEGDFDSIDISELGPNRRAFVTITGTSVEVFVTCFADLDADGQATFFDVSAFLTMYNANDMGADLNNDGQLNFFDVSALLSAYDAGC